MTDYSDLREEELYRLIAEKDMNVVEYVYDKYSPAIFGLILQKIKSKEVAKKILVDTFVSFIKSNFSKSPVKNLIFTNLHNIARSFIKKRDVLYVSYSSTHKLDQDYSFKYHRS